MLKPHEKIASILRVDKDVIKMVETHLSAATGKTGVIEKILQENEAMIANRLDFLGLGRHINAKQVSDALTSKIEADDHQFFKALGGNVTGVKGSALLSDAARRLVTEPKGFFLKRQKAEELLRNEPPQKILQFMGYKSVDEILQKQDLLEVFSALRFLEDREWLNNVFFKQYETLTPDDFEEREIVVRSLSSQWAVTAQAFVEKKYHNISHLKELGVIFIIPVFLGTSGELIRNFSLVLHYSNEVPFYSKIFRKIAEDKKTFAANLISLLRGDVRDERIEVMEREKMGWMVIQRYLAKEDENDWRLFEPHVNPEALHWTRAGRMLVRAGAILDHLDADLAFWQNLDWVGDFFKTDIGVEVLISCNLVDTAMSLVKEKELIKYLYHHQESLWNKIFTEYFGEEEMERMMVNNILRGWFEV